MTNDWRAAASGLPGDSNATNYSWEINQFLQTLGLTIIPPGGTCLVFGGYTTSRSVKGDIKITNGTTTYHVPADIVGALQPAGGDPFSAPTVPKFPASLPPPLVTLNTAASGWITGLSGSAVAGTCTVWTSATAFYLARQSSAGGYGYANITPYTVNPSTLAVSAGTTVTSPGFYGTIYSLWLTAGTSTVAAVAYSTSAAQYVVLSATFDGATIGAWTVADTLGAVAPGIVPITGNTNMVAVSLGGTSIFAYVSGASGSLGTRNTVTASTISNLGGMAVLGTYLVCYQVSSPTVLAWCSIVANVPNGTWSYINDSGSGSGTVCMSAPIGALLRPWLTTGAGAPTAGDMLMVPQGGGAPFWPTNYTLYNYGAMGLPGSAWLSGQVWTFMAEYWVTSQNFAAMQVVFGAPIVAPYIASFPLATVPAGYTLDQLASSTTMPAGCWLAYSTTRYCMVYADPVTNQPYIVADYTQDVNGDWIGNTQALVYDPSGVRLISTVNL